MDFTPQRSIYRRPHKIFSVSNINAPFYGQYILFKKNWFTYYGFNIQAPALYPLLLYYVKIYCLMLSSPWQKKKIYRNSLSVENVFTSQEKRLGHEISLPEL